MNEQKKQSLQTALAEIEELKQSQRVVEISLAKQIEEKEALKHLIGVKEGENAKLLKEMLDQKMEM